ncbi:MAG: fumarate hydratase [Firmicutes bacterium]|nr:fumarate hydratase [Bacillota bacterium]
MRENNNNNDKRIINTEKIKSAVYNLLLDIMVNIDANTVRLLEKAYKNEKCQTAKFTLKTILDNDKLAKTDNIAFCQDTGLAVVFLEIGQDVALEGEYIENAVNQGVREAYKDGYFRKSVVDPLTRQNTKDNTPAIIHTKIVEGSSVKVNVSAKGFGSENMSMLFMLPPQSSKGDIIAKVVECVKTAGAKPCPPIVIGVGIGGTMEKASLIAKYALTRDTATPSKCKDIATLEQEMLMAVNKLNIGVHGFGGDCTALAVHIETYPTHIAGLPLAVNINCFATRHGSILL